MIATNIHIKKQMIKQQCVIRTVGLCHERKESNSRQRPNGLVCCFNVLLKPQKPSTAVYLVEFVYGTFVCSCWRSFLCHEVAASLLLSRLTSLLFFVCFFVLFFYYRKEVWPSRGAPPLWGRRVTNCFCSVYSGNFDAWNRGENKNWEKKRRPCTRATSTVTKDYRGFFPYILLFEFSLDH